MAASDRRLARFNAISHIVGREWGRSTKAAGGMA